MFINGRTHNKMRTCSFNGFHIKCSSILSLYTNGMVWFRELDLMLKILNPKIYRRFLLFCNLPNTCKIPTSTIT